MEELDGFLETAEPGLSGLTVVTKRKRSYKHPMIPTTKHPMIPIQRPKDSDWRYSKNVTEDDIRLEAYFIWERSGKKKSADECWMAAKEKLGAE